MIKIQYTSRSSNDVENLTRFSFVTTAFTQRSNFVDINIQPSGVHISSSEFWEVCETHFLLVEFLTILVLQTEKHKLELNYFTEALLKVMSRYEYPIALKIEEYFLSDPEENETRPICDESIIDELGGHNMKPVEYETLARIKRLSSDSLKGLLHHCLGCGHASSIPG
jgi:hypothetical protein